MLKSTLLKKKKNRKEKQDEYSFYFRALHFQDKYETYFYFSYYDK